jgi:hypothetical protein
MKQAALLLLLLLGFGQTSYSQSNLKNSNEIQVENEGTPFLKLNRTSANIVLDGNLDEPAWFSGKPADNFWQYFPSDSVHADQGTQIFMTYDDNFLYVGVKCYSIGENYVINSLRRDFRAGGNDNITLLFDTFNDETNAFMFGLNPAGVRREGLISGAGQELRGFTTSWDNKWYGDAKIHDGFWVAEFAIPFKTLRFKEGTEKWRFNCYRFDTQNNERTTWARIPRNQWIFNLAYMGEMIWDEPLGKTGTNISIIPYVTGNYSKDFESVDQSSNWDSNFGGDAKIAVTSGLNLDLTVNPDFSQVEVDEQVLDLNRFEIFFPERRQFFLENADLFSTFGSSRINPFFSRRIGITRDTATDINIQTPIQYGARLSGKLNNNLRMGLLNMQTSESKLAGMPGFNYTVATLQHKVFARSNVGLIFANKQALTDEKSELFNDYNRVIGVDYNIASKDNYWNGKVFYHQNMTPVDTFSNKFSQGFELSYTRRKFLVEWLHQYVSDGFDPELGFVPRKDFFRINPTAQIFFYPKKGPFNQTSIGTELSMLFRPQFGRTDHEIQVFFEYETTKNERGRITLQNEYTYLFDSFDPTGVSDTILLEATDYNYTSLNASYSSDQRKDVSFRINPTIGEFFNGFRAGLSGNINFRFQPYGSISINYSYNYLDPDAYFEPVSLYLIGPRFDLTFSKKVFLTAFFQYNSQSDNFNINTRFQWRFQPVSDFFLVYTDNYNSNPWGIKNRAIVAKITYWLNL